jgi:hypothetical protein
MVQRPGPPMAMKVCVGARLFSLPPGFRPRAARKRSGSPEGLASL